MINTFDGSLGGGEWHILANMLISEQYRRQHQPQNLCIGQVSPLQPPVQHWINKTRQKPLLAHKRDSRWANWGKWQSTIKKMWQTRSYLVWEDAHIAGGFGTLTGWWRRRSENRRESKKIHVFQDNSPHCQLLYLPRSHINKNIVFTVTSRCCVSKVSVCGL